MPLLLNQSVGQPIEFSQGDTVLLDLLCTDDNGIPQNLTGATFMTQIQGSNIVGPVTFPDNQHVAGDQSTDPGTFQLSLTSPNTESCGLGPNKEILTTVVIGGTTTIYRGESILTVFPMVPIQ